MQFCLDRIDLVLYWSFAVLTYVSIWILCACTVIFNAIFTLNEAVQLTSLAQSVHEGRKGDGGAGESENEREGSDDNQAGPLS